MPFGEKEQKADTPTEQAQAKPVSLESKLNAPKPQGCCDGGNCAQCGKQQPVIESSPEFAVMGQQVLVDLDAFFVDLKTSREAVTQTVNIEGVAQSGDGSVAHVGKTTNALGTIAPAESSVRYYQAPSPLLSSGLGTIPVVEKLVSIGSIPKQAASEGFHATGSLRDLIPGAQEQRSAPATATFADRTTTERREAQQSAQREKASPALERTPAKAVAVQQPERVREVAKIAPSPAPSTRVEQAQTWKPAPTPSRVEHQQPARTVNYTSPPASTPRQQSVSSFGSSSSSAMQTRGVPSSFTSATTAGSTTTRVSQSATPRNQAHQAHTAHLRMPRTSATSDTAQVSKVVATREAASLRTTDRQLRALEKSQSLIRSLDRLARELITKGLGDGGTRASGRISEVTRKIASLVKNAEIGGLRSLQQRRAVENLRLVARSLTTRVSPREYKIMARVMASALRRLNGGVERLLGKVASGRTSHARTSASALTRKALLNARLATIRSKLERIKATYRMRSSADRRVFGKRPQSRASTRRNLTKGRESKNMSRVPRRSSARQMASAVRRLKGGAERRVAKAAAGKTAQSRTSTRRNLTKGRESKNVEGVTRRAAARQRQGVNQTRTSARRRSQLKSDRQRQEIKALRREVRALRDSLQDIIPMMEMMKTLTKKRRSSRMEEDFDLRGFTSERQLAALLKRKNLSTLERKRIERELAKRRKAKGSAGALKSVSASSKKQSGATTAATQEASQGQNKQTDAEMKSYAKTLSTFLMRTDDTTGDEDEDHLTIDQDHLGA